MKEAITSYNARPSALQPTFATPGYHPGFRVLKMESRVAKAGLF